MSTASSPWVVNLDGEWYGEWVDGAQSHSMLHRMAPGLNIKASVPDINGCLSKAISKSGSILWKYDQRHYGKGPDRVFTHVEEYNSTLR